MRFVGVDLGERRIGLAVSDASATLARPLATLVRERADRAAARALADAIEALDREEEVAGIVVGLPSRLDGAPSSHTPRVLKMAKLLAQLTAIPILMQDERLSSHEAEERLRPQERDWRRRKAKLDAAAAAVILQDYLDQRT